MSRALARFSPSRVYLSLTLFAIFGALLSAWNGLRWAPSWIAAALFAVSAVALAVVTMRPAIEIHETHLLIGRLAIPWRDVRRIDQTGWNTPLAVALTLSNGGRILLLYPGDLDSSSSLLRHVRRFSSEALLDGIPYRQYGGEHPSAEATVGIKDTKPGSGQEEAATPPARYPMLRPEDEDEVERLFQRLKSVGHLESKNSDEK